MSNYRKGYFDVLQLDRPLTPKQRRRMAKKTARDLRAGHYQTAGWGGVPGECGVECACGTTFDNFDTIAEAAALLDSHIRQRNPIGNANPPKSLSGHPGRRRAQLAERQAIAEEREIARALRRAERESAGRQSAADIVHAQSGGGS